MPGEEIFDLQGNTSGAIDALVRLDAALGATAAAMDRLANASLIGISSDMSSIDAALAGMEEKILGTDTALSGLSTAEAVVTKTTEDLAAAMQGDVKALSDVATAEAKTVTTMGTLAEQLAILKDAFSGT